MKLFFLTCLFLALTSVSPRAEDSVESGNYFYDACSKFNNVNVNLPNIDFDQGECLGFVKGVNFGFQGSVYCVPSGVTYAQTIDIYIKYLEENPDLRHLPAAYLLGNVMQKTFPCPKNKK